jgi:hypothetical protein
VKEVVYRHGGKIATIGSSLNRLLLIGSSFAVKSHLSRNQPSEKVGQVISRTIGISIHRETLAWTTATKRLRRGAVRSALDGGPVSADGEPAAHQYFAQNVLVAGDLTTPQTDSPRVSHTCATTEENRNVRCQRIRDNRHEY